MSDIQNNPQIIEDQESSIDFGKIFKDLLRHKRLYFIVLPVAFVLAAIYALSPVSLFFRRLSRTAVSLMYQESRA